MTYELTEAEKRERERELGWYWVGVEDHFTARAAARRGSWVAFYVVVSYIVTTAFLFFADADIAQVGYVNETEKLYGLIGNIVFMVMFLGLGLAIRWGKFFAVPIVFFLYCVELYFIFQGALSAGLFVKLLFLLYGVNAMIGWWKLKKYPDMEKVEQVFD
ncbi:hypothetical protein [Kordiimonas sp. SCSIO 12610]|uniref:hypothetical protein n=1 Tax=Kordiimonas sp. SCSIO 12610 TaxID=2829597 RepID=UPI00210BB9E9|nr:hypothetical protein [Kordiimonas sp. SCSIO 12610]UTW56196.1 hypothetical protein KFF44_04670 [Kordiimonas sp. SCSIO 12610]